MINSFAPAHFSFTAPGRIIFGANEIKQLPAVTSAIGESICVVCGKSSERIQPILDTIDGELFLLQVSGEPDLITIQNALQQVQPFKPDIIVGIGGGSVLDSAKAIAALLSNPGTPLEYLEIIGKGKPLLNKPVPFVAVPTTSGTGAEATANAVIGSNEHRVKVSLRSTMMLPEVAIVDPQLTTSLPPGITASTGMDALTQVLEPFVSPMATPITDLLCHEGIYRAGRSLEASYDDGSNLQAREDMSLTSLYGGLALANAKLGAVHGIAGPFGGMFPSPHGAVCAVLLPHVMRNNIIALQQRLPASPSLHRYQQVASLLTGRPDAESMDGADTIEKLVDKFDLPGLSHYGLRKKDTDDLVDKAFRASSMKGNPVQLTRTELSTILTQAM